LVVGRDLSRANRGRRLTAAARAAHAQAADRRYRPNSSAISRRSIALRAHARRWS